MWLDVINPGTVFHTFDLGTGVRVPPLGDSCETATVNHFPTSSSDFWAVSYISAVRSPHSTTGINCARRESTTAPSILASRQQGHQLECPSRPVNGNGKGFREELPGCQSDNQSTDGRLHCAFEPYRAWFRSGQPDTGRR